MKFLCSFFDEDVGEDISVEVEATSAEEAARVCHAKGLTSVPFDRIRVTLIGGAPVPVAAAAAVPAAISPNDNNDRKRALPAPSVVKESAPAALAVQQQQQQPQAGGESKRVNVVAPVTSTPLAPPAPAAVPVAAPQQPLQRPAPAAPVSRVIIPAQARPHNKPLPAPAAASPPPPLPLQQRPQPQQPQQPQPQQQQTQPGWSRPADVRPLPPPPLPKSNAPPAAAAAAATAPLPRQPPRPTGSPPPLFVPPRPATTTASSVPQPQPQQQQPLPPQLDQAQRNSMLNKPGGGGWAQPVPAAAPVANRPSTGSAAPQIASLSRTSPPPQPQQVPVQQRSSYPPPVVPAPLPSPPPTTVLPINSSFSRAPPQPQQQPPRLGSPPLSAPAPPRLGSPPLTAPAPPRHFTPPPPAAAASVATDANATPVAAAAAAAAPPTTSPPPLPAPRINLQASFSPVPAGFAAKDEDVFGKAHVVKHANAIMTGLIDAKHWTISGRWVKTGVAAPATLGRDREPSERFLYQLNCPQCDKEVAGNRADSRRTCPKCQVLYHAKCWREAAGCKMCATTTTTSSSSSASGGEGEGIAKLLAAARTWAGEFDVVEEGTSEANEVDDEFNLEFVAVPQAAAAAAVSALVKPTLATVTGQGKNKYGRYEIRGVLKPNDATGKGERQYLMQLSRAYLTT